jgi:hypothetical protein
MKPHPLWSWGLALVGLGAMYLVGQQLLWGWLVGVAAQLAWIAYAVRSRQWGFVASALAYGTLYLHNFLLWSWTIPWR